MLINNDVLSIISIYSGIPLKYNKNRLIIDSTCNCDSCDKRMRHTHKSIIETYVFPKLWKIDNRFMETTEKYIRDKNTFIKDKKEFIPYFDAINSGLIEYEPKRTRLNYSPDHIYGAYIIFNKPNLEIYVKKKPSLELFYKALKDESDAKNNKDFCKIMKTFKKKGLDDKIMEASLKRINVESHPIVLPIKLCKKCRNKVRKGYIFT